MAAEPLPIVSASSSPSWRSSAWRDAGRGAAGPVGDPCDHGADRVERHPVFSIGPGAALIIDSVTAVVIGVGGIVLLLRRDVKALLTRTARSLE